MLLESQASHFCKGNLEDCYNRLKKHAPRDFQVGLFVRAIMLLSCQKLHSVARPLWTVAPGCWCVCKEIANAKESRIQNKFAIELQSISPSGSGIMLSKAEVSKPFHTAGWIAFMLQAGSDVRESLLWNDIIKQAMTRSKHYFSHLAATKEEKMHKYQCFIFFYKIS